MSKFFTLFAALLMAGSIMAGTPAVLYSFNTEDGSCAGSNNSYAGNCDIEITDIVWNVTGNSQMAPWRVGGKQIQAIDREVYSKTAFTHALDSIILHLGTCSLASLDGVKLVYSTNADFSNAQNVVATVPAEFPANITFAVAGGFPANAYYKFVFTCTESSSSNKFVQFVGVDFWGQEVIAAVAKPVFSVAAGSYYDAQTVALSCETEGAEIHYTVDGSAPTAESTLYTEALTISTTTTVKAVAVKEGTLSDVVEKKYDIAVVYASLTDLVNNAGAPAGQKVVVTLTNETIDSLYVSSSNKTNGIYLTAADRMVEIYCYNVPAEWEVGGTVSGVVKGEWKEYNGTWEVCPSSWDGITYTPAPTYFFKHPWNGGDWTWKAAADTTFMGHEASYVVAEWGNNGFNFHTAAEDAGALWYDKDIITSVDPDGHAIGAYPAVGTKVTFVCMHDDFATVVGGSRAWIVYTPTTALEHIASGVKATKVIENGQVVIIRDGKRFSLVGAAL